MSLAQQIPHTLLDLYRVPTRMEITNVMTVHSWVFMVNNICVLVLLLLCTVWMFRVKGFTSKSIRSIQPQDEHHTQDHSMKKTSRSESSLSPDVPSSSDDEDENDLTMASPSEKSKNSSGQSQTCLTTTCPTLNLKIPSHFLYESIILSTKSSSSKPFQPSKLLFVFRAVACVWSLVTILLYQLVYIQQGHLTFLSFLTNVSFVAFTAYFTLQTVLGLVHYFLIHWRKDELTPLLSFSVSNVMWFLSELTITASILVCIGFWSFASFEQYKPLRIDCYFNFSVHGIVGIFALFEFLLSNISFRFWHVFMIAMYPTAFFLWLQILAETRLITLFPYSMSNYFKFPFTSSVIYTFGMPFVFILTFCILCYFSKLRRLHVMTQKH